MSESITEKFIMQSVMKKARQIGLKVDCLGRGDPTKEILIVSEAPGEREAAMGMPFVGGAGAKLWTALRDEGVNRRDCYVTNVCKRQVSLSNKTDARSPVKRQELEHWESIFDWEMDQLPNLKYILCLGNFGLKALIGEDGITNWRGSVVDAKVGNRRRDVKVICTYNPAHVIRNPKLDIIFKFDLMKMGRVLSGEFRPHIITPIINPSYKEAMDYLDKLVDDRKPVAFDIETMGNETACFGFANNPHEGICISLRDTDSNRYSLEEERDIYRRVQQLLHNEEVKIVAQSGGFDSYWCGYKDRIHVGPIWFDTLLAHHTLYPRLPHNLGFLTGMYTEHPYYKDEGKNWREEGAGGINQFWEYNVKDVCITWAAHDKLHVELKQQGMDDFFFNHVMRLQPHLVQMTVTGLLSDIDKKEELIEEYAKQIDEDIKAWHSQVQSITGDDEYFPNPQSPTQLKRLFFDRLNLTGYGTSTDKANRERMRNHPQTSQECRELLVNLDSIKEKQKLYGTYLTSIVDPDGRTRCEYKQYGTQSAPGRLSSSQVMWGSGTNLQNQPHFMYQMYLADKGYMLSYFDLRQAEAKVVAFQWQVKRLIENFKRAETEEGFDIHRGNASDIFQVPYQDIPVNDWTDDFKPTRRYLGKRCVHGLNYRMGPDKLAEVCQIPFSQALEAYRSYHQAFPEIQQAWRDTITRVRKEKVLYTPLGRRMIWLGMILEEDLDSVVAFVPQSTIGDKVCSVIYKSHEDPDWPRETARMWANIHDALIALHLPEDKDAVQSIMRKYAEEPIIIRGQEVSIGTDFKESVAGEDGWHRWSTLRSI